MIRFPHLGIVFRHVGQSVSVFGFEITFYGIIIAAAMIAGIYTAMKVAERTGQNPDMYFNFAIIAIVCSILGARLYYVAFSWDYYHLHPDEIMNIRGGGLAIYGGVIAGVLSGLIYSLIRKVNPLRLLDTAVTGLVTGQIIGRWGNFFNREAFGEYTDSFLAMQLPLNAVNRPDVTQKMMDHLQQFEGTDVIQVHPTFLYESLWNILVLAVLLFVSLRRGKRFEGEVFLLYLAGYGIGRFWIEMLRTDQLLIPGTHLPVSQVLSGTLAVVSIVMLIRGTRKYS